MTHRQAVDIYTNAFAEEPKRIAACLLITIIDGKHLETRFRCFADHNAEQLEQDYNLMGNNADNLGFITPNSPGVVKGFSALLSGSQGVFPGSSASIEKKNMPEFFNSLTKQQQEQLAVAVVNDPNGKNAFATFMESFNTAIKDTFGNASNGIQNIWHGLFSK